MSHKATAWAFEQNPGSPVRKFVLICLADCHNAHTGQCNPSVVRLAKVTGYSRRAVINALQALEEHSYIAPTKALGRSSNYRLCFDRAGAPGAPVPPAETGPATGAPGAPAPDQDQAPTGAPDAPVHDVHQCTSDTGVVHEVHGGGARRAPEPGKNLERTGKEDEEGDGGVVQSGSGWLVTSSWTPPADAIARARMAGVPQTLIDDPEILADFRLKYSEAPQRDPAFSKRWVSWLVNEHRSPGQAPRSGSAATGRSSPIDQRRAAMHQAIRELTQE